MENNNNTKAGCEGGGGVEAKPNDANLNSTTVGTESTGSDLGSSPNPNSRTPFTNLSQVDSDLALARTLQEQLMYCVGHTDDGDDVDDDDDNDSHTQETWEEVDPDELSYEELLALGDIVGTQSRGLSAEAIASLPSAKYKAPLDKDGSSDQCVICRLDYEDDEALTVLSCKHSYHPECINNWLQINKLDLGGLEPPSLEI
ncbi:hypothetical protein GIB67_033883 [Kingdonia uniflora]|uniref:RING-type domain-containing protein n=1 Tax=Kingdonia uniflora TaxID=39325 RepID=A0A7J7MJA0_9MAGN|nr:hypothetical protein GIB67_033883 [Kingdonia uniflora]